MVGTIAVLAVGEGWWMSVLLRWTGLAKLVCFYRYLTFNGPQGDDRGGCRLGWGLVVIWVYWLAGDFSLRTYPLYLVVYVALLVAAGLLASVAMVLESRPAVTTTGWVVGIVMSVASIGIYGASRTAGLPGLPELVA
jgi:hypothetical protein